MSFWTGGGRRRLRGSPARFAWNWSTATVAWPSGGQAVGVAPERAQGDDTDAAQPVAVALAEPVVDRVAASAWDHVEQAAHHRRVPHLDPAAMTDRPVPQPEQPTISAVVSPCSHSSPCTSIWAPITNSGMPSRRRALVW